MKLADLSDSVIKRIKTLRYDQIIEKHEGPEQWASCLKFHEPEFMTIGGHTVLLPVGGEQHAKIKILRCIESRDGKSITVFLKDTTFLEDPTEEKWSAGFFAFCEKLDGEDFYVASVYHEWYIVPEFGPVKPKVGSD